jgi:D-cysteine desulfhydrase
MIMPLFKLGVVRMKPEIKQLTQLDDIYKVILSFNADIVPSMTERGLDLKDYAQKLCDYALMFTLWQDNQTCGFVTFYANDKSTETAYLAQIAVKPKFCNQGMGHTLLNLAMETAKEKGMQEMKLEVYNRNQTAISFYEKQGFSKCDGASDMFTYMRRAL